jgi:hypothetical protein
MTSATALNQFEKTSAPPRAAAPMRSHTPPQRNQSKHQTQGDWKHTWRRQRQPAPSCSRALCHTLRDETV